jgi:hypothetical protein
MVVWRLKISQKRTCLSSDAEATRVSLKFKAMVMISSVWPIQGSWTCSHVDGPYSHIVESGQRPAESRSPPLSPLGLHVMTGDKWDIFAMQPLRPVLGYIWMPKVVATAINLPEGEYRTQLASVPQVIMSLCGCHVSVLHGFIVLSSEPDASAVPSRDKYSEQIQLPEWAVMDCALVSSCHARSSPLLSPLAMHDQFRPSGDTAAASTQSRRSSVFSTEYRPSNPIDQLYYLPSP